MITRKQVAARLGKSVATVRRIEGILLIPVRDRRGIHRFHVDDVERLAQRLKNGELSLWQELRRAGSSASGEWFDREVKARTQTRANAANHRERDHQKMRECLRALGAFIFTVCTPSQRRQLDRDVVEALTTYT